MNIAASSEPRIVTLEVTEESVVAQLADGRTVSVPLAWSWRLANATPAQRSRFEIIGSGEGVHWPDIDEDLSTEGLLRGAPAPGAGSVKSATGKTRRSAKRGG